MNALPKLLNSLAWALVVVAVTFFVGAFFAPSAAFEPLKNAVPAGVLLALAGHLFTQARNSLESAEKRSLFNLESCIKAFDHARTVLADGNNDRTKWIEAGRSLGHAEELASGVTVDAHLRVLELNKLKYRSYFHDLLESKDAAFFYGVPAIYPSLDEAAKASTAPEEDDDRMVASTLHELAETSIRAVWQAAQWPANYQDPLGERFSDEERGKVSLQFRALHTFLDHKQRWQSASGRLWTRSVQK